MTSDTEMRGWPRLAPLVTIPILLGLSAAYANFVPDDLYIYLQFVRNLLEGAGPSFNSGQPTYGFTSALWLGVLTAGGSLSGNLVPVARALSLMASAVALVAMTHYAFRLSRSRTVAWAATVLLAVDLWFLRWAASGMEASLSVALLLAGFAAHVRETHTGRGAWSVVCFALLTLVRPEALLLLGLSLLDTFVPSVEGRWQGRRLKHALIAASVIVVPWFLFATWRFGTFLPDTASAKGAPGVALGPALASLSRIAKLGGVSVAIPGLMLSAGILFWWLSTRRHSRIAAARPYLLPASWLLALPLAYAATGVTVYSRYLLIWTPLVLAIGLTVGYRWFQRRGLQPIWAGLVVLAMAQNLGLMLLRVAPASREYGASLERVNVEIGRWLFEHTPPGSVVAAENIGAIGYYSRRPILDMNGLITPSVIPYRRQGRVDAYLEQHPPDYAVKIHSRPDPWGHGGGPRLSLQLIRILQYDRMFLTQTEPVYYTLYRVGE